MWPESSSSSATAHRHSVGKPVLRSSWMLSGSAWWYMPRRGDRVGQRHPVVDQVRHDVIHRGDDRRCRPACPTTSNSLPVGSSTIVGVIAESIRLPGAIGVGVALHQPHMFGRPGAVVKSSISSLSRNPAPGDRDRAAVEVVEVVVMADRVARGVHDRVVRGGRASRSRATASGVGVARRRVDRARAARAA